MFKKTIARRGFTLIELLVVIAIIAVLIALLLPAVQKVRAAAARIQCINNLKQLALANHSYHGDFEHFPSGGSEDGGAGTSNESWGWGAFILPYIEQSPLYNQLGVANQTLGSVGASATLRPLSQTPISTFLCPSDTPFGGLQAISFVGNNFPAGWQVAKSNYVAVAGGLDPGVSPNDGIIYLLSQTRIADVTDGTSNTFLLGERSSAYGAGAWIGNRNPGGTGTVGSIYTLGVVSQQLNAPSLSIYGFSSNHTGGANFALGDGSVRFVLQSISFNNGSVYPNGATTTSLGGTYTSALGTYNLAGARSDGVPLGSDWNGF